MSTLVYGAVTRTREENPPGETDSTKPPGMKTYVDALAALIPAEILALHAIILGFTTTTTTPEGETEAVTTITDPQALRFAFWGLLAFSILVYALGRRRNWESWDAIRVFIPALAFIGWTMLQKTTAFDAIAPGVGEGMRQVVALLGAAALGIVAAALAYKADQHEPSSG